MLIDKYQPKTLDDLIGLEKVMEDIIRWCNLWLQGVPDKLRPAILFVGAPGTGKTTAAEAICHDCGWNIILYNASDVRTKETLHELNPPKKDIYGRQNCIVFDEADSLEVGGTNIILSLIETMKYPVIFTANNRNKVPKKVKDKSTMFQFFRPSASTLREFLITVSKKEGLSHSKDVLDAASNSKDYRIALSMIEYNLILEQVPRRKTIAELTKDVFFGQKVETEKSFSLIYYIDENAFKSYDPLELYQIYEELSRADISNRRGQEFGNTFLNRIPISPCAEESEIAVPIYFKKVGEANV